MRKLIILLILTLSLTSGCATYIKSRANDLADCFTVRGWSGIGLGVRAQVTNYVSASVGATWEEEKSGYFGREPVESSPGIWLGVPVPQVLAPLLGVTLVCTDVRFSENLPNSASVLGINIAEFLDVTQIIGFDFSIPMRIEPPTPLLREKFFIEAGVALGLVGFDAGFNPVEFVDFLLGWTTLDITGDD